MSVSPLVSAAPLPEFTTIKPEHVEPTITALLSQARDQLAMLLQQTAPVTWDNLLLPLEEMDDTIDKAWSTVSHLNAVMNTPALRQAYNACLPLLADYGTELSQNVALYHKVKQLQDSPTFSTLSVAQQKVITDSLRDFQLAGVHLEGADKARYKELIRESSQLSAKFDENLLDATNAWQKVITDPAFLAGIPAHALAVAQAVADSKQLSGYCFTLDYPSYAAVVTYADNRALREEFYTAYVTRASDVGPTAGQFDNSAIMLDLVKVHYELAKLVGFDSYASYSLATKMAPDPATVLDFLNDLVKRSHAKAQQEFAELAAFAKQAGCDQLQPWDVAYYSEKMQKASYDIDQETLRPYFPIDQVLQGLFTILGKLYGLTVRENTQVAVWHDSVRFFEIFDESNQLRGQCYLDLYARANKRGGAWMDECRVRRRRADGSLQTPVAYLVCNFTAPTADQPALLTHDEVLTLFHEFGHGLHHLLTRVEQADVSGINGVPWDAVELPSQFFENWCWDREALNLIAKHYQTSAALPAALYNKMLAAKNFQSAMGMVRQLEFSLFDFRLYLEYRGQADYNVQALLDEVRAAVAVVPIAQFNRFQHGFSHIFSGGYSAGYYSYKWADVLASDAFSLFEENGIFDATTGRRFLQIILEQGGTRDPLSLFTEFRGRAPTIDALLRHVGLV